MSYKTEPVLEDYSFLIGRVMMASVFFLGSINWIFLQGHGPVGLLEQKGWPFAVALSWLALLAKATGSLSVVQGFKTRYGALLLAAFTLVASVGCHLPQK